MSLPLSITDLNNDLSLFAPSLIVSDADDYYLLTEDAVSILD